MTISEEILKRLDEAIEVDSNLTILLAALKADIATAPADPPPPPAAPAQLIMTAAANGMTYDQYKAAGWTDDQMITGGVATAPADPPPPPADPPPPPADPPSPPADPITPEELNTIMIAEFNRLGDRAPIDEELKKLDVTGVAELPVEKYQELIDNVKAIVKAV